MEIPPDEILDGNAPLVNAKVAFAEDVGLQGEQIRERVAVLAAVREQRRVQRTVDVLAEQHALPPDDRGVNQRTGRVAGVVRSRFANPTAEAKGSKGIREAGPDFYR